MHISDTGQVSHSEAPVHDKDCTREIRQWLEVRERPSLREELCWGSREKDRDIFCHVLEILVAQKRVLRAPQPRGRRSKLPNILVRGLLIFEIDGKSISCATSGVDS